MRRVLPLHGSPVNAVSTLLHTLPNDKQVLKDLCEATGFDHVPTWEEVKEKVEGDPDADGSNIALLQLYMAMRPYNQ